MLLTLLVANLIQGTLALVWIAGLRRVAGPLPPSLLTGQLAVAVGLGPLFALWRVLALPPPPVPLVRAELWAQALVEAGPVAWGVLAVLLGGTGVLFVVQELAPALRARHLEGPLRQDPHLDAVLARVLAGYHARGMDPRWNRTPHILAVESGRAAAAVRGLTSPRILVARGLVQRLEPVQLEAAVAHETAHLVRGGNLRLLRLWLLRALQAVNPAVLVMFRALLEAEEIACDALAARATERPAVLASALLALVGGNGQAEGSRWERAHRQVVRRADLASTRLRVRNLLDTATFAPPVGLASLTSAAVLVLLYWGVA